MEAYIETLCLLAQPKEEQQLKNKNNQNCQKIEQYQNSTTKDIKKKHSSRPVAGAEMVSWVERTHGKVVAHRPSKVADCGAGKAKLQLAGEAAAGGSGDRLHKPEFEPGEI